MTRVIVAVTNDLSYDRRMHRTCNTLSEAGYAVTLVGRELPGSRELGEQPYEQVRLRCKRTSGPGFYAEYNLKLYRYLTRANYDIGLACDLDTVLPVVRAARKKKGQCVYDAHEYFSEVPELGGRPIVKNTWRAIGRYAIPRFTYCYTVGDALADALSNVYKTEFGVVRNVPELNELPFKPYEERSRTILYQGALNKGRGIEQALEAMKQLPDFRLIIAGEGDLSGRIRHMAMEMGISDKVEFKGMILPGELPELTRTAMVGLNLLEYRSQSYHLSLANKFFDYMHAGTPSINMAFPEYKSILERHEAGLVIENLEPSKIVSAVRQITANQETWERFAKRAYEARMEFHWDNEKVKLLAIFERLSRRI